MWLAGRHLITGPEPRANPQFPNIATRDLIPGNRRQGFSGVDAGSKCPHIPPGPLRYPEIHPPHDLMNPNITQPTASTGANLSDNKGNPGYLALLVLSAALGGLLFGYDTAVVSGAETLLQKHFALDALQTGWAASCVLIGCLVGALIAGPLADSFGRKKVLFACALLFTVSAIGCAMPEKLNAAGLGFLAEGFGKLVTAIGSIFGLNLANANAAFNQYVFMRFLGGLGIGISSMVAPTYLAEIAPERIRGRLVTGYQMAIVTGIFVVFFVNKMILSYGDDAWDKEIGWRWM